ncbi:hypothetical protein ANN_05697 [Periplaneta americana]|uniref:Uncharacterized protein n=1 Tax=Periplaneta americana TaxID=6978 RepID=A0ABQ8TE04_PERAM|nr:hypothetical protein ANN_05697 [Periplaneta americana]
MPALEKNNNILRVQLRQKKKNQSNSFISEKDRHESHTLDTLVNLRLEKYCDTVEIDFRPCRRNPKPWNRNWLHAVMHQEKVCNRVILLPEMLTVLTCYGTKIVLQWLKEGKLVINKISQLGPVDPSTNSSCFSAYRTILRTY